ncbi:hypothetical protein HPC49_42365 [Pyxidicoccus fallax]|uniref:Uncharacterized protein n=1 Tax=Pyxidicoccus fallax TaxID=394095 RepID=A0A848LUT7_9BACT|nr:hypothetical protein [Pyxidicoccus fallax]NMO21546.1 hypothetical protein [Pyxidicoccus fallax]NPC84850.1 hypothetical protein [Pyxidicoccus fallax]
MSSNAGADLLKLAFRLVDALESYGLGVQVMVGLFALGFVGTFVAFRRKPPRDKSD